MTKPITPSEVVKQEVIPDFVFEVFNELIQRNHRAGRATVKQSDAEKMIKAKMGEAEFDDRWLDVEDHYRDAGWQVEYDKPGYNETYPATYTFVKKSK